MKRAVLSILPLLAAALLGGCSSPTESDSVDFDITLTASADPASATSSTGVQYKVTNADDTVSYYDYDYRTSFSVTVRDNAGIALDITAMNLTVQQATGGIVITPSGGDQVYFKFNSSAVTNHVNKNGSADVGFDVWYDLPSQGKEALITVAFTFSYTDEDDNEYTYSKSLPVRVAP
jgi:hypothetical protein